MLLRTSPTLRGVESVRSAGHVQLVPFDMWDWLIANVVLHRCPLMPVECPLMCRALQCLLRPSSKVIVKFLQVMQKHGMLAPSLCDQINDASCWLDMITNWDSVTLGLEQGLFAFSLSIPGSSSDVCEQGFRVLVLNLKSGTFGAVFTLVDQNISLSHIHPIHVSAHGLTHALIDNAVASCPQPDVYGLAHYHYWVVLIMCGRSVMCGRSSVARVDE